MIETLLPLLDKGAVALVFKAEANGQVRITFTQKPTAENKVPIPAFSVANQPAEVEHDLAQALTELAAHRDGSVADVLARAKADMDAAAAAEKAEAEAKRNKHKTTTKVVGNVGKAATVAKVVPTFDDPPGDEAGDDDDDSAGQKAKPPVGATANTTTSAPTPALFD